MNSGLEFEFPPKLKIRILAGIQILNQFQKISNFKRDYLDKDNDSEFTVNTKNAPCFMNFSNIYKLWPISLSLDLEFLNPTNLKLVYLCEYNSDSGDRPLFGVQNKEKQGPCAGYQNPIEKLMSIPSFSDSA